MYEQQSPGNGVTWRELHQELQDRDCLQQKRDEEHRNLLEEIRDSLGDVHTVLTQLRCDAHATDLQKIQTELADLKANAVDWRTIRKVVPTGNAKLLVAAITVCAGALGWDWWDKIEALLK